MKRRELCRTIRIKNNIEGKKTQPPKSGWRGLENQEKKEEGRDQSVQLIHTSRPKQRLMGQRGDHYKAQKRKLKDTYRKVMIDSGKIWENVRGQKEWISWRYPWTQGALMQRESRESTMLQWYPDQMAYDTKSIKKAPKFWNTWKLLKVVWGKGEKPSCFIPEEEKSEHITQLRIISLLNVEGQIFF